jgi:hypothetical protein
MLREPSTQRSVAGAAVADTGSSPLTAGLFFPRVVTKALVMASAAAGRPPEQLSGRAEDAFRPGAPERGAPLVHVRPLACVAFPSGQPPADKQQDNGHSPSGVGFQRAGSGRITQCRQPAQPAGLLPNFRNGQFGTGKARQGDQPIRRPERRILSAGSK